MGLILSHAYSLWCSRMAPPRLLNFGRNCSAALRSLVTLDITYDMILQVAPPGTDGSGSILQQVHALWASFFPM